MRAKGRTFWFRKLFFAKKHKFRKHACEKIVASENSARSESVCMCARNQKRNILNIYNKKKKIKKEKNFFKKIKKIKKIKFTFYNIYIII